MTPQEQQMISGLIDRVQQTQLPEKDSDAEQMLQQGLGRNPDSLYILSQTVLVQQFALDQAQKQLSELKSQLATAQQHPAEPKHATSFLGSIFGSHDDDPKPTMPAPAYNQTGSANPPYTPVQNYSGPQSAPPPPYAQTYPQPGFGAPAGGGFLRSALQTATGVAAGALAFQGVESLLHGFGGGGMGLGGGGMGGGPREEVVNNYYGDSGDRDRSGLSSDIDDRRNDGDNNTGFFNPGHDASSNTDQFAGSDDSSNDDSSDFSNEDTSDSNDSDSGSADDLSSGGDDFGGSDDSSFS